MHAARAMHLRQIVEDALHQTGLAVKLEQTLGIQLVFYDNEGDCTNAAMALRYAIHGYYGAVSEGSTFPSPDYQIGAEIGGIAYYDSPSSPFQGRWNPAYQVAGHPMAICNYNRFNDLESPIVGGIGGSKQVHFVDSRGHPWRGYSFPRMYAVFAPILEGMGSRRNWHC